LHGFTSDLVKRLGDEDLPLEDVPYELTTWQEWRERDPETDIYVGG
jgi:hypothetical protein